MAGRAKEGLAGRAKEDWQAGQKRIDASVKSFCPYEGFGDWLWGFASRAKEGLAGRAKED